jgi:hypothetical protein
LKAALPRAALPFFQFLQNFYSPDTWEYELSHVLDIYTDDFVHKCIVALTSWKDISQDDKMKAMRLLLVFISANIASVGPHSLLSSTYGLDNSNLHLHYRNCQRAGAHPLIAIPFNN